MEEIVQKVKERHKYPETDQGKSDEQLLREMMSEVQEEHLGWVQTPRRRIPSAVPFHCIAYSCIINSTYLNLVIANEKFNGLFIQSLMTPVTF